MADDEGQNSADDQATRHTKEIDLAVSVCQGTTSQSEASATKKNWLQINVQLSEKKKKKEALVAR